MILTYILSVIMSIQNLVKILGVFILKILCTKKKTILASIEGRNSVANLEKMTLYNPNIDLVNDNVYTKFV